MVAAVQFITPTDISGTYDSTWRSYDCTSIIPGGMSASGVLIRYKYANATSVNAIGFRRGDSTDTRVWNTYTAASSSWEYAAIGLDSSDDTFDYNVAFSTVSPTVQVVGFFDSSHVTFFQNGTAYTPGNGAFSDVDISSATGGDTAIAGIFQIDSQRAAQVKHAWRKNGGSEDIYGTVGQHGATGGVGMVIVEVDGSEICEWKQDSSFGGASAILVGYIKSGFTFGTSGVSTGTTGSYVDVAVTSGAVGAYVEMIHTSNTAGVSKGVTDDEGSDDPYGASPGLVPMLVPVTLTDKIRQKIASTSQDLYLRGTVDGAAGASHETSGTLSGGGSTVDGAAARMRAHATAGGLSGDGATLDATAHRAALHITSGELLADGAIIDGAASRTRVHPAMGELVGGGAIISGDAIRSTIPEHFTSGSILGGGASVAGSASRTHIFTTSGTLTGGGAVVDGAAAIAGPAEHASSGDIEGGGSSVEGQAGRYRAFGTSGAIAGDGAAIVGVAAIVRTHATSGELFGDGAIITGVVIRGGQVELLHVTVTARAAFACVVSARAANNCTVSEAIAA